MGAMMELMAVPAASVFLNDSDLGDCSVELNIETAREDAKQGELRIADIEAKREKWEATAYRTSNQQLYAVLADCLAYAGPLPTAAAKQRAKELDSFLKARGYRVNGDSPLVTRVVKAVFGNVDRRRISTYSLVLRSAQKEGVAAADLSAWIEGRGGVQEIKLSRSPDFVSPKQKAEQAKSTLSSLPTLAIAKDKLAELADADFVGSECVLLAEQQADGSFHIKALVRSGGAVNAALTAVYGLQKKEAV